LVTSSTRTKPPGRVRRAACGILLLAAATLAAQPPTPQLTEPVNDFAGVVDAESAARIDEIIRSLERASGDVVVVATIDTFKPYADIREYAVKMFENHGRGIGQKGRDNGLLILLAVQDRQVWIEVGYDLEEFITDGYAGETTRKVMVPEFRRGAYGAGLFAGVSRLAGRIAERRNVTLQGAPPAQSSGDDAGMGAGGVVFLIMLLILLNIIGRTRRRRRYWGGSPWSGWHSGVGPFGGGIGRGGFGGGFGGFGGGGFGGFGGGRSGGGGGGGSW
jgi:uncharacterized protein